MSEFSDHRKAYAVRRAAAEDARITTFTADQALRRATIRRDRELRTLDPASSEGVARRQAWDARIAALEAAHGDTKLRLREDLAARARALDLFAPLLDPRERVAELDDGIPILMAPLRLECRFMQADADAQELWVRVFPDDWAVDSFEPFVSDQELANATRFWALAWAAGDVEADRRAAWRDLEANHGAGRASWVITQVKPAEPANAPSRPDTSSVVLVIVGDEPAEPVLSAARNFWEAMWRAGNDQAAIDAATTALDAMLSQADAESVKEAPPANLALPPAEGTDLATTPVQTVWLPLDRPPEEEIKAAAWAEMPRCRILPERLVLRLERGDNAREQLGNPIPADLALGPDPMADAEDQLHSEDGTLKVPDELAWMFDFDRAVKVGMGFRVPLDRTEARAGFDRVYVLGVRLSDEPEETAAKLTELLDHHHRSTTGFALLPQGAPTNNTGEDRSAHVADEETETTFDRYLGDSVDLTATDPLERPDGQWLVDLLGLEPERFEDAPGASGRDQTEARAMNAALWPATLGYYLEAMLSEVFDEETVEATRDFFEAHVIARGIVPAIRIGDQPYGILPATPWSRLRWIGRTGRPDLDDSDTSPPIGRGFLLRLYQLIQRVEVDWHRMAEDAPRIGQSGDPQQLLLDIIGLHPASVEFHQRYIDSVDNLYNLLNLQNLGTFGQNFLSALYVASGREFLQSLGANPEETPEILEKVFHAAAHRLRGPLIDDRKLSEVESIRSYADDGRNYLAWLTDAADTSIDALRRQEGFADGAPRALLYLLLRHALQLGHQDAGLRVLASGTAPVLNLDQIRAARRDDPFIHIRESVPDPAIGETRYDLLYRPAPQITGNDSLILADHIAAILGQSTETRRLRAQIAAVRRLTDSPTARLERVFVEHLDSCSWRLDAWKQGVLHHQLERMRFGSSLESAPRRGLHVGVYGWLEELRPRTPPPEEVSLPAPLRDAFDVTGPILNDPLNQGYLHAPSLNQAVTAAVLRNGYLSNATPDDPGALAVNLTSRRVREAMSLIEGIRNQQELAALLGYRLERDLHDNHELAETDLFIYALREKFSLVANKLKSTRTTGPIETMEARNVVDGVALIEHIEDTGEDSYPFGLEGLAIADAAQRQKIDAAVRNIRDLRDAVSDLGIAESVHQALLGATDAAAATLDAYSRGRMPALPEVTRTPRQGIAMTHRMGLMLNATPPAGSPWPAIDLTPRAVAEPVLNHWFASRLPAPDRIGVVTGIDGDAGAPHVVTVAALELQPIDLIEILRLGDDQVSNELDDRIEGMARTALAPLRASTRIEIRYADPLAGGLISLFELAPLARALRGMAYDSRPLRPTDVILAQEASQTADQTVALPRARLEDARVPLAALEADIGTYIATLEPLLADETANRAALLSGANTRLDAWRDLATRAAAYGLVEADIGFANEWRLNFLASLDARLDTLIANWQRRADQFDGHLAHYDSLPAAAPVGDRFSPLQRCERLVSTVVTSPLPEDPADMRADLVAKKAAFDAKLAALATRRTTAEADPNVEIIGIEAELPLDAFVREPFTLEEENARLIDLNRQLAARAATLLRAVQARTAGIDVALAAHDATAGLAQAEAVQAGLKRAFGEGFQAIPSFTLQGDVAAEVTAAHGQRDWILRHLTTDLGRAFPLDEWLYGVARVRDRVARLERATILAEGFGQSEIPLWAWQFPFAADDFWVGAEFPDSYELANERLLVTLQSDIALDTTQPLAGILIDEWTEVAPGREATTGVAFHFDQPNSEPPQAMLLLTPAMFTGAWSWDDVRDAVADALDSARLRAVEPEQIDRTDYARVLPAVMAALAFNPVTIDLNLAAVNGLAATAAEE